MKDNFDNPPPWIHIGMRLWCYIKNRCHRTKS